MGQKTNPIGLRIALNRDWRSKWYADKKDFGGLLAEDHKIRSILKKKLETAAVPRIQIERAATRCRVTIHTARPGVVIGRKGAEIDKVKEELSRVTGKEVYVDIQEVKALASLANQGASKKRPEIRNVKQHVQQIRRVWKRQQGSLNASARKVSLMWILPQTDSCATLVGLRKRT